MRCLLWLFLLLPLPGRTQAVAVVDEGFAESWLTGHLWYIPDTTNRLTAAAFAQGIGRQPGGIYLADEVPNLGDADHAHWVGFQVRSRARKPLTLLLELDFVGADSVEFFLLEGGAVRQRGVWQPFLPTHRRNVPHRVPAWRFVAEPGRTYVCALRLVKTGGYLVAPVTLFSDWRFNDAATRDNLLHGMSVGCVWLAALLGLMFGLLSGRAMFGYYSLYAIGIALFLLEEQGYLNQFLHPNWPVLAGAGGWAVCSLLSIVGHTLFVLRLLAFDRGQPAGWRWAGWAVVGACGLVWVVLVAGATLTDMLYRLGLLLNALYMLLAFSLLLAGFYYKRRETPLYLIAAGPFFLTVLWICGSSVGWLPETWLLFGCINYTPVWEVLLLGIGLAVRFTQTQRQRLVALHEAGRLREQLTTAINETQELERQRIAQDLHDDVGNTLAAAKGGLTALAHNPAQLPYINTLLDKASRDLRAITHNLLPVEFDKYTLPSVVRQSVERANAAGPTRFEFIVAGPEQNFPPEQSLVIYRICNELITNVLKYAQASLAVVQFVYRPDALVLTVEDDGVGFEATGKPATGIGLRNIASRASYIGAVFEISSSAAGTLAVLEVPYEQKSVDS